MTIVREDVQGSAARMQGSPGTPHIFKASPIPSNSTPLRVYLLSLQRIASRRCLLYY